MTTQENLELYRRFATAVTHGCEQLTMEVTSQALKYHRTLGIEFNIACFMNFGLDHISAIEHADAEDYLSAKLRIFGQCRLAVINQDSEESQRIMQAARAGSATRLITFGLKQSADLWASEICSQPDGLHFMLNIGKRAKDLLKSAHQDCQHGAGRDNPAHDGSKEIVDDKTESYPIKIKLSGQFNVENALAAIVCALDAGAPISAIQEGLACARVPGRMELFLAPNNKTVIVDYAHNLMSFEALFSSVVRDYPAAPITAVFGCPGYKAYSRRRDLAEICARYNASVILTEEDSGEEPTREICNDIACHLLKAGGGEAQIIEDRQTAIGTAISQASAGAVILITGKGRETRQKRGQEYIPVTSDVQMVENFIAEKTEAATKGTTEGATKSATKTAR